MSLPTSLKYKFVVCSLAPGPRPGRAVDVDVSDAASRASVSFQPAHLVRGQSLASLETSRFLTPAVLDVPLGFPTSGRRTGQHRQSAPKWHVQYTLGERRSASTTCQFPVGLASGTAWANWVLCPPSLHRPAYGCRCVCSTRPTSPFLDSEPIRVFPAVCTQPAATGSKRLQMTAGRMQKCLQASIPRYPASWPRRQLRENKTGRNKKDQTVARGSERGNRPTSQQLDKQLLTSKKR